MIKVLGLALYGDKAASARYRLFQYKSLLEESGIERQYSLQVTGPVLTSVIKSIVKGS